MDLIYLQQVAPELFCKLEGCNGSLNNSQKICLLFVEHIVNIFVDCVLFFVNTVEN